MRFNLPAVLLICVIVSACGREAVDAYAKVQAQRSPLIDGFESYATGSQIREKLKEIGEILVVIEESHLPPGDTRPKFDVLVLVTNKGPGKGIL